MRFRATGFTDAKGTAAAKDGRFETGGTDVDFGIEIAGASPGVFFGFGAMGASPGVGFAIETAGASPALLGATGATLPPLGGGISTASLRPRFFDSDMQNNELYSNYTKRP
jgi:hypothetical protein